MNLPKTGFFSHSFISDKKVSNLVNKTNDELKLAFVKIQLISSRI